MNLRMEVVVVIDVRLPGLKSVSLELNIIIIIKIIIITTIIMVIFVMSILDIWPLGDATGCTVFVVV